MNIIFLDIDGVLLPDRAKFLPNQTKPYLTVFDPCAVGIINRICKETDALLVIHISWLRATALVGQHCVPSVTSVEEHMINQGLNADYFHDDSEALWRFSGTRWQAISDWLNDHNPDAWVALDDEVCSYADYIMGTYPNGLIITTSKFNGIEYGHYLQIVGHFQANGARQS